MAEVKLVNVKKIYPFVSGEEKKSKKKKKGEEPAEEKKVNLQITDKGVVAVQEFNLDIADKEFIVLVGPSGCGKSTTLRMVAGLEEISEGELYIDGKLMNDVAPKDRDIAMVFQNYALYPHMTVYDNMAFSLKLKKTPKAEIDRKVREAAEILDITQYLNRKPKALSGGQRQRVAIGRAIVRNPKVFLMDEPLSNLDAKLRNQMRAEIIKLREKIDTTFIYVTHDQVEAMTLGDRIVIMRDGFIQQIGTPQEVFNHPANLFVAGFIGTPQMNFFDATLAKKGDKYVATVQGKDFELPADKQEALKKMDKIPDRHHRRCPPGPRPPVRGRHRRDGRRLRADGLRAAPARQLQRQGRRHRRSDDRHRPRRCPRRPQARQVQLPSGADALLRQGDREEHLLSRSIDPIKSPPPAGRQEGVSLSKAPLPGELSAAG